MSAPAPAPLIASVVCVRRARGGSRIDKLGIEVAGELRHYHPAGVLFALKLGAWRLFVPGADGVPLEVEVAVDEYERESLRVRGASEDDGLQLAARCTHQTVSGVFRPVG
jgi:hypothetical protein